MEITEHDIRMFYELLSRYNIASNNIAIVGSKAKYENHIKQLMKYYKNTPVKIIKGLNKFRILTNDDVEITWIHIERTTDLTGYYFKKFI